MNPSAFWNCLYRQGKFRIFYNVPAKIILIFFPFSKYLSLSERNETTAEGREILVTNLKSLGADLTESVEFNDRQLTETLLTEVKDVWRRIMQQPINVSFSLEDDITNLNDDLIHYTAKLLFLAKYGCSTIQFFITAQITCGAFPFP